MKYVVYIGVAPNASKEEIFNEILFYKENFIPRSFFEERDSVVYVPVRGVYKTRIESVPIWQ